MVPGGVSLGYSGAFRAEFVANLSSKDLFEAGNDFALDMDPSAKILEPLRDSMSTALKAQLPLADGLRVKFSARRAHGSFAVRFETTGHRAMNVVFDSELLSNLDRSDINEMIDLLRVPAQHVPHPMALNESLRVSGNIPETLKCVLGCVVPATFVSAFAANVASVGLGCLICQAAHLEDTKCTSLLEAMLLVPIALEPVLAYVIFKVCTPVCPWHNLTEHNIMPTSLARVTRNFNQMATIIL